MEVNIGDTWYRYDSYLGDYDDYISVRKFKVVSTTPKGVYVIESFLLRWKTDDEYVKNHRRLILHHWSKKYAYPTQEEALQSLVNRKYWQIKFAQNTIKNATAALDQANKMLESGDYEDRRWAIVQRHEISIDN